jgi:hypothetical protein
MGRGGVNARGVRDPGEPDALGDVGDLPYQVRQAGLLDLARLPKRSGPSSSRLTVVMDRVHCGQVSTSAITCHTRS